jgi:hypothetical protein
LADFTLPLVAAMSTALLAACSPGGDRHRLIKVCVDRLYTRVADLRCLEEDGSYTWYYISAGGAAPPLGGTPSGGSLMPAAPASSYSIAAASGEAVSRGGFGSSAGDASGHGGGDAGGHGAGE